MKETKNQIIQNLLSYSNIPKRYKTAIFEPKTTIQNEVAQYLIENFTKKILDQSSDILLFGSIGTGKTYISCAFAIELIHTKQKDIKYIREYDLLFFYFEKRYKEIKIFRDSGILILDDIGNRTLLDWERIELEELLSHRYNELLPTIFITNLEEKDFMKFLGDKLASRLRENRIKSFPFRGESLRGKHID